MTLRETFDTGVQAMRPMYYDWPQHDAAYTASSEAGCTGGSGCQYMLGPEILVSPVLSPAGVGTLASVRTWLPPGAS